MKQGKLYTKIRKEAPADEVSKSAQLLIKGGFIHKELSGVYSFLPLGLKIIQKIQNIIREEMNSIGGTELEMTSLQDPTIWQKTNRWDDEVIDVWFRTKLKNGTELGLAITHEEPIVSMMKNHLNSYKDLPVFVYQFQKKFRNETRAKSGIMRTREFLMKDLYSFCLNQEQQDEFYAQAKDAYFRIFERLGIGHVTYLTKASGGAFSKFSEEFQTVCESGEDLIYLDSEKGLAINKEIYTEEIIKELDFDTKNVKELKTSEVGNIFNLGTRFSEDLELLITNQEGKQVPVVMGSYGIGIGRVMGVIAEVYSGETNLLWPKNIAPFNVHILQITTDEESTKKVSELEKTLQENNIEFLTDDRDKSAGEKFKDAEAIGLPIWIIVGKDVSGTDEYTYQDRILNLDQKLTLAEIVNELQK